MTVWARVRTRGFSWESDPHSTQYLQWYIAQHAAVSSSHERPLDGVVCAPLIPPYYKAWLYVFSSSLHTIEPRRDSKSMTMASTGKSVFIIGPGFILTHSRAGMSSTLLISKVYQVTGFVRRKEHGEQIAKSGAQVVQGDLNDKDKITEQTAKHDITIHTATADHLPSAEAVLDGIKQRASKGLPAIFIHTSGTSVLDDGALNAYKSDKIYHDDIRSEIDSVPDTSPHREIDLAIVKAQKQLR
ncbi:hypothetical protein CERZMDRAFT_119314 [Cercospora zeae-maydis SCOH1-5]|uniref:NAD(P)-binding domain-containing protein n=1 Tax=Cercospora zeae-maydis SCOH1-5 TaxID=717836 RepID=A0A6A6F1F4_9PEZI|nr:hypothetical protein CERZMDRAFT_119314 [Cercospora zeae-maydis SCOH1-5]